MKDPEIIIHNNLFGIIEDDDEFWIAKEFFNSMSTRFLSALDNLLQRENYGDEYAFCEFPELGNDFEGVKFYGWRDEHILVVEKEVFENLLDEASSAYITQYPSKADAVSGLYLRHGKSI